MRVIKAILAGTILLAIFRLSAAQESFQDLDIPHEVELCRQLFSAEKTDSEKSRTLEGFMTFIDQACRALSDSILTREFSDIVFKYSDAKENHQVVLMRGKNTDVDRLEDYMARNGLLLWSAFGGLYFEPDPLYIRDNFKGYLPEAILEYYMLESIDQEEGFEMDAALEVPWDTVRIKIIRLEDYCPRVAGLDFPGIKKRVKEKMLLYFGAYLVGLHNSWLEDHLEEAKNSYKKYLAENSGSGYADIIRRYFDVIKDAAVGRTKDSSSFPTLIDKNDRVVGYNEIADGLLEEIRWRLSEALGEPVIH